MFWNKIIEKLSFPITIVLVVVGVLIFSFIDPLGMFNTQKTKLEDTPVTVESIQQIGQLITAEYYGEVVESLGHKINQSRQDSVDSMDEEVEEMKEALEELVTSVRNQFQKKKRAGFVWTYVNGKSGEKLTADFRQQYTDLKGSKFYPLLIKYLQRSFKGKDMDYKMVGNWLSGTKNYTSEEQFVFRAMVNEMDRQRQENIDNLVASGELAKKKLLQSRDYDQGLADVTRIEAYNTIDLQSLVSNYTTFLIERDNKYYKNGQLVLLGRGWVKAGFDFENFSEKNFRYNANSGVIDLIGLEPTILSATINPWFIPEKGIPGFEIIISQRKATKNPAALDTVKTMCLQKLESQAMSMKILQQAQENAKMHLEGLFSLLLERDVTVRFHTDEYNYVTRQLLDDGMIQNEELLVIDSMLFQSVQNWGSKEVQKSTRKFIDTLRKTPVYINGVKVGSSELDWGYASMAFLTLSNFKLDSIDVARINKLSIALNKLPAFERTYCDDKTVLKWSRADSLEALRVIRDSCVFRIKGNTKDEERQKALCREAFAEDSIDLIEEYDESYTSDPNFLVCRDSCYKFGSWAGIPVMKLWHPEVYSYDKSEQDLMKLKAFINSRLKSKEGQWLVPAIEQIKRNKSDSTKVDTLFVQPWAFELEDNRDSVLTNPIPQPAAEQ